MQRLLPSKSLIAVIDVQERLAAAMPADRMATLTRGITVLLDAAQVLGAGVLATEQYPRGLGPTVSSIGGRLVQAGIAPIEKTTFSAADAPELVRLNQKYPSIIVVGMEAHVCVYQTVRDLVNRGFDVYVPADAVVSRREEDRSIGIELCARAGAIVTTVETVVFDWLERAGTDDFRSISKLLR